MADIADEIVHVPVPRRFYALIIRTLSAALAAESEPNAAPPGTDRNWTTEEFRDLQRGLGDNKTALALMKLTCASPGTRVTFRAVQESADRTYGQARADLARFTRRIRERFGKQRRWPVHVVQGPDKGLMYDVMPHIADAWNEALKQNQATQTSRGRSRS